jgi:glycosyltransferase involved in cell wall biosynthesis
MTSNVDIILPTFNPKPEFIDRAIQSVINQTYDDWSLYIVQDGGEEDLKDIIERSGDSRVHFLSIPHQGKAAALNYAIAQGGAKFVAYLDDDDIWYPNHLEVAVFTMCEKHIRFLHTDAHEIFLRKVGDQYREISRNVLNRGSLSDLLLWYVSHINTVHERSLIEKAGPYDETRRMFIDWDMLLRMAHFAKPHHLPIVTCEHNIYLTPDNKTANTISRVHSIDPEYSRAMHDEMFRRAFELLAPEEFVIIVRELDTKTAQLSQFQAERTDVGKQSHGSNNPKSSLQQIRHWLRNIF